MFYSVAILCCLFIEDKLVVWLPQGKQVCLVERSSSLFVCLYEVEVGLFVTLGNNDCLLCRAQEEYFRDLSAS